MLTLSQKSGDDTITDVIPSESYMLSGLFSGRCVPDTLLRWLQGSCQEDCTNWQSQSLPRKLRMPNERSAHCLHYGDRKSPKTIYLSWSFKVNTRRLVITVCRNILEGCSRLYIICLTFASATLTVSALPTFAVPWHPGVPLCFCIGLPWPWVPFL